MRAHPQGPTASNQGLTSAEHRVEPRWPVPALHCMTASSCRASFVSWVVPCAAPSQDLHETPQ